MSRSPQRPTAVGLHGRIVVGLLVAVMFAAHDPVRRKSGKIGPAISWIMNRATRVPASIVVKMNKASNRMPK